MQHNQDINLAAVREKIKEIKIAMFKSDIKSELKLPNNIIETLQVEEDGTIWFFTTCFGNHAAQLEKSFYAQLNYYKKGSGFHLQIDGNATIIENNINYSTMAEKNYDTVLIKMNILHAGVFEIKKVENISLTQKIKQVINNLFMPSVNKSYNFSLSQTDWL